MKPKASAGPKEWPVTQVNLTLEHGGLSRQKTCQKKINQAGLGKWPILGRGPKKTCLVVEHELPIWRRRLGITHQSIQRHNDEVQFQSKDDNSILSSEGISDIFVHSMQLITVQVEADHHQQELHKGHLLRDSISRICSYFFFTVALPYR